MVIKMAEKKKNNTTKKNTASKKKTTAKKDICSIFLFIHSKAFSSNLKIISNVTSFCYAYYNYDIIH